MTTLSTNRVLIIDDDPDIQKSLSDWFEARGFEALTASDGLKGLHLLQTEPVNLALIDIQMPALDGLSLLRTIQKDDIDVTVVIVTAYGTVERAVEAMQAGAYDFIQKPFTTARLQVVVDKAMERERLRQENAYFRNEAAAAMPSLIGEAPRMRDVLQTARKAAQSNATVLLLGESGTGKEVLARDIHKMSLRQNRPFVGVNCVALAPNLLESELFGHERGAFSYAIRQKKGKFEIANGGTLLLDEIGATTTDFQKRLLRVLQEGEIERVGAERSLKVDVRVIAATNRNLKRLIAAGDFLEDLYYRLHVVEITLPPLRERKEDIPLLAYHFLKKSSMDLKRGDMTISASAMHYLTAYDWPGNIRELENTIERAVVLGAEPEIRPRDLPPEVADRAIAPPGPTHATTVDQLIRNMIRENQSSSPENILTTLEELAIRVALEETRGNKSKAALLLGFTAAQRKRLERRAEKYDL